MPGCLLLFFFSLFSIFAHAQRVVVEATALSGSEVEASRSVTVVDENLINLKKPATLADLLRDVPGVEVVRQGGVGQTTSVFIRGARSEDTLVLIDGIHANDAISPACGYDFSSLSPQNVSRIEVFRGPQGVRFGAGALGGVINIITKEGSGPLRTIYALEAGTADTLRSSVGFFGSRESLAYSFGYEEFRTTGFSAAGGSRTDERDGAHTRSFSGKLIWKTGSTLKAETTLRYAEAEMDLDRGGGALADDPNNSARAKQLLVGVSLSDRFFEQRLASKLAYSVSQSQRSNENKPDTRSTNDSTDDFASENKTLDTNHELTLTDQHSLRLDAQWREETGDAKSRLAAAVTEVPRKTQSITGAALTYLYDDDDWFADVGARQDQHSQSGPISSFRLSGGRRLLQKTAKLTLTYGTGFKPPSLYQLYSIYGNLDLRHEVSDAIDATYHQKFSSQSSMTIVMFRNSFQDLIDYDFINSRYTNISNARTEGTELQIEVPFTSGFAIETRYAYLESKDDTTGAELLRRSRHSGSFTVRARNESQEGFLQYRWRGKRPDLDPATFARTTLPAYGVFDLGAHHRLSDDIKLTGRVENVLDLKYEEAAGYGTPGLSFFAVISGEL